MTKCRLLTRAIDVKDDVTWSLADSRSRTCGKIACGRKQSGRCGWCLKSSRGIVGF